MDVEDEFFEELADEEESAATLDAALLDDAEDEFVQASVDANDLATGFSATIPAKEIDVDEDTQGDEDINVGEDQLLTQFEVTGKMREVVHGDEIELDLAEALTTGRTVAEAPEGD
jgi:hypothetical protein